MKESNDFVRIVENLTLDELERAVSLLKNNRVNMPENHPDALFSRQEVEEIEQFNLDLGRKTALVEAIQEFSRISHNYDQILLLCRIVSELAPK